MHQLSRVIRLQAEKVGGPIDPMELFLRADGGLDGNSGKSSAKAVKTMPEFVSRVAEYIRKGAFVIGHMGDGTYPHPSWFTRLLGDKLCIIGDGAGQGDGFSRIQESELAGAGSGSDFVEKVGGGLTPNDPAIVGKTIRLLTGPGAPARRFIESNTASGFVPSRGFDVVPDDTTTYEIVTSTVELEYTGFFNADPEITGIGPVNMLDSSDGQQPNYSVMQCRLVTDDFPFPAMTSVQAVYYGVEFGGSGTLALSWDNCSVQAGMDDFSGFRADVPVQLGFAGDEFEWLGWGFAASPGVAPFLIPGRGLFNANGMVIPNIIADRDARMNLYGGRLYGNAGASTVQATRGGAIFLARGSGSGGRLHIEASGADHGVECLAGGTITASINVVVDTAAGALYRAKWGSILEVNPDEICTSASGPAVLASQGGKVYIHGDPAPLVGTPLSTAFDVGGGIDEPATFFSSDGIALFNPADGSLIQRAV